MNKKIDQLTKYDFEKSESWIVNLSDGLVIQFCTEGNLDEDLPVLSKVMYTFKTTIDSLILRNKNQ